MHIILLSLFLFSASQTIQRDDYENGLPRPNLPAREAPGSNAESLQSSPAHSRPASPNHQANNIPLALFVEYINQENRDDMITPPLFEEEERVQQGPPPLIHRDAVIGRNNGVMPGHRLNFDTNKMNNKKPPTSQQEQSNIVFFQ